jgi:hypothetical protein
MINIFNPNNALVRYTDSTTEHNAVRNGNMNTENHNTLISASLVVILSFMFRSSRS